jgi:hypothetical protein
MSRLHPHISSEPAASEPEVFLDARQQAALRAGLQDLAPLADEWEQQNRPLDAPLDGDDEKQNHTLLNALFSGRDLRPWPAQVITRLRWMLPAVAVGFGITLTLARIWNGVLQQNTAPTAVTVQAPAPPPLPPLPADLIDSSVPAATSNVSNAAHDGTPIAAGKTIHPKEDGHDVR